MRGSPVAKLSVHRRRWQEEQALPLSLYQGPSGVSLGNMAGK